MEKVCRPEGKKMPFQIVRNDITKMEVDAIVNAASPSLLGGGGVDGAIHRAAGPGLVRECRTLGGCETGKAKITGAYRLPCRYVIHTVGPIWQGGGQGEDAQLRGCYHSSLLLAALHDCESVAFPLISSGTFGYPKDEALQTAIDEISSFLLHYDMTVYLVIYDPDSYRISGKLFADITEYIDDHYVEEHSPAGNSDRRRAICEERERLFRRAKPPRTGEAPEEPEEETGRSLRRAMSPRTGEAQEDLAEEESDICSMPPSMPSPAVGSAPEEGSAPACLAAPSASPAAGRGAGAAPDDAVSLSDAVEMVDESFSQMLLRKIDEKGMTDAECYRRANIDRRLFSKIRSNPDYRPSRQTALAFAIALQLPMNEVQELLMKAGFCLSRSSRFDIIVTYFIEHGNYNLFEINEALFQFDQVLLGG